MRFSVLASGSSGNACYVETGQVRVLIDAGLSAAEVMRRLERVEAVPEKLDAILVTHEHLDHIRGVGPLSRRFGIPVYLNRRTLDRGRKVLGNLPAPLIVRTGDSLTIGDLTLETFTKCHDAADPMGVVVACDGVRLGIATDFGCSTRLMEERLGRCRAVILEFNHDLEMLARGPYPLELQRRIKGRDGHLSNEQGRELLETISHDALQFVVLAHLSQVNNDPQKAYERAIEALAAGGSSSASILLSSQDAIVSPIDI